MSARDDEFLDGGRWVGGPGGWWWCLAAAEEEGMGFLLCLRERVEPITFGSRFFSSFQFILFYELWKLVFFFFMSSEE